MYAVFSLCVFVVVGFQRNYPVHESEYSVDPSAIINSVPAVVGMKVYGDKWVVNSPVFRSKLVSEAVGVQM